MRNTILLISLFSIFIIASEAQSTVKLAAFEDSFLYYSDFGCPASNCYKRNVNYGNQPSIHLSSFNLITAGTIGFDLGGLYGWDGNPSNLVSVRLYLPPLTNQSIAPVDSSCAILIYPMNSNWNESTIIANNLPVVNMNRYYSVYDSVQAKPDSVSTDITSYVQQKVAMTNQKLISFYLKSTSNCALPSREAASSSHIYLRITFNTAGLVSCGDVASVCNTTDGSCCDDAALGLTCYGNATYGCSKSGLTSRICAIGNSACGQVCYDPTQSVCLAGNQLCAVGWQACGGACFNSSEYDCVTNSVTSFPMLCPKNFRSCGDACYDPSVYQCYMNSFLCGLPFQPCGDACYSTSVYKCQSDLSLTTV